MILKICIKSLLTLLVLRWDTWIPQITADYWQKTADHI